jgi:hypothetical protein
MLEPISEPNRSYENEPVDLEYDFDPRRDQHNDALVAKVSERFSLCLLVFIALDFFLYSSSSPFFAVSHVGARTDIHTRLRI